MRTEIRAKLRLRAIKQGGLTVQNKEIMVCNEEKRGPVP